MGPLSPGAPKHCLICFYVNPAMSGGGGGGEDD